MKMAGVGTDKIAAPAIELRNITKRYENGTLANDDVSLRIEHGEIHAICGENGAGKSTIMKMVYGLTEPTAGKILVDGAPRQFRHPREAIAAGIGLVAQHLNLVQNFTIAENVVLGSELTGRGGILLQKEAEAAVAALASKYGMEVDPAARVSEVSVGMKQRTEILKALYRGARILLMDEPTAVLTPQETDELFAATRHLVKSGVTMVIITHKLAEVKAISDRLTVLRDGKVTGSSKTSEVSLSTLAEMMVGRPLAPMKFARKDMRSGEALLAVRNLGYVNDQGSIRLSDINFDVAAGEILGVAGVEGNGQNSLTRVLSGLSPAHAGKITLNGNELAGTAARARRTMGIATVPEDRLTEGVAGNLTIEDNLCATSYFQPAFSGFGWLRRGAMGRWAAELIKVFGIKADSGETPVKALSGGNMQKVVLAREISGKPKVLIAAQPTRGVDIGAAGSLREQLVTLRDRGAAVLLISADLEEVLGLSDRIMVLFKGQIVAHVQADSADQREVGFYMTGLKRQPNARATLDSAFTVMEPETLGS